MSQFLVFLIAGAVAGSFYAIMASGLVLTYSTSGVFNFAHGAVAYLTALLYYELNTGLHWPIAPAAVVSVFLFAPLIGLVLDKAMFRRLTAAGTIPQIVATVGLAVALPALGVFIVETLINDAHVHIASINNILTVPGIGPTPTVAYSLGGGASINTDQIAALAAAILAAVVLWFVTRRTTLGLEMRATVDQRTLAGLRRINPDRSSSIAWILATTLAGLTGVLAAPIVSLQSSNFTVLMLTSAAAAVFALLRSIPIAFAAGIGLGIVEDIVAGYINPHVNINGFGSAVPFVILLLGLLVLNRTHGRVARVASEEGTSHDTSIDLPRWRRGLPWALASVILVVFTLGPAPEVWVGLVVSGLCVALIFLSIVMVTGVGGMVSLAQATFVTAAGMIAGLILSHHVNFDLALLGGVATAAALGAIVALPALRLGGLLLALATLALALIGDLVVFQIGALFNGNFGWTIPKPAIGPWQLKSEHAIAILMFVVVGGVVAIVRNIQRSPSGRSMFAVRSAPTAAATAGISPFRVRLTIFVLSAAIAGLGGVLYGSFNGLVNAQDFPAETGLLWLAIIVVLGIRKPGNAVIAGLVYTILPYLLSKVTTSTQIPEILFGLGGVGLAKNPEGALSDMASQLRQLGRLIFERRGSPGRPSPTPELIARESAPPPRVGLSAGTGGDGVAPALQLVDVFAGYEGVEVLHGVSVDVTAGSIVALLGANGAGKSTLCRVAAGSVVPTGGQVIVSGDDATDRPTYWRSRNGVLVAPEGRGIFPSMTVDENIRVLLPGSGQRDVVYGRFPMLASRRSVPAGLLSGGEQQILSLAPLLVDRPKVLIADEPTLGLAPLIAEQVFAIIRELRDDGVAILLIEEKTRDVLEIADRLAVLRVGTIAWAGTPAETSPERLAAGYLGVETRDTAVAQPAALEATRPQP